MFDKQKTLMNTIIFAVLIDHFLRETDRNYVFFFKITHFLLQLAFCNVYTANRKSSFASILVQVSTFYLNFQPHHHHHPVSIRFLPRSRRWQDTSHSFRNRSHIFNPTSFTLSSTCFLHVIFGRPRFRFPFTSSIIAFFRVSSSFLLITRPYHLTPFAFAILSNVCFKPNISIRSSNFFLSINFAPHIDLTICHFTLPQTPCLISI